MFNPAKSLQSYNGGSTEMDHTLTGDELILENSSPQELESEDRLQESSAFRWFGLL